MPTWDRGRQSAGNLPQAILLLALTAGCIEVGPDGRPGGGAADERTEPGARPVRNQPSDSDQLVDVVHRRINAYRESRGLEVLEPDEDLSRIAEQHSRRMASGQVPFGHAGFEERAQTIRRDLAYGRLAENVGYNRGVADPAGDAVERWLRSPQHLANVAGDFEITGLGVGTNGRGEYYFTQIFVKPL
ncbi:MAG: CAP domain-containing protein [Thermomicrobiales bacterium]